MNAPPLILFDLDDTLCDYSGARIVRLRGAFRLAFEQPGIHEPNLDDLIRESIAIHPHGSDHFPALLARHGVENPEFARAARRWYHANRFLGLELFPGAREMLATIRLLSGVETIGIITNGPAEVQRDKLALLDLHDLVDFAVISGELGAEKPDPRIFDEALYRGRQTADHSIYIGDSPEFDMDGAYNAGIDRVWVNADELPWIGTTPAPDRQIRSITELPQVLNP